jgi:ubiquinone/menaquinone biosynthesis C-methylase UbiE
VNCFTRRDGVCLPIVPGFRERILSSRQSVTPREGWSTADYETAAAKKQRRFHRLLHQCQRWIPLGGAALLDVGCGDGANCLLFGVEPVREVVGIDLFLPLHAEDAKGDQTRAFARALLGGQPQPDRVRFAKMDATRMAFDGATFDLVISRSAMEHITPIEDVLCEITRVARPGALIYLAIDPFYWVRGCHKRGVVDIPFAHARLDLEEYTNFVTAREGAEVAAKRRRRLETLNRFTVAQWRNYIHAMPCDILAWENKHSKIGQAVLQEFPNIPESLLPGVSEADLLCERIEVWLRRK